MLHLGSVSPLHGTDPNKALIDPEEPPVISQDYSQMKVTDIFANRKLLTLRSFSPGGRRINGWR